MTNKGKIIAALAQGPLTAAEIQAQTGLLPRQINSAINGMKRRGLILGERPYKAGQFNKWTDPPQRWYLAEETDHETKD